MVEMHWGGVGFDSMNMENFLKFSVHRKRGGKSDLCSILSFMSSELQYAYLFLI
jgi:hypothetical protein